MNGAIRLRDRRTILALAAIVLWLPLSAPVRAQSGEAGPPAASPEAGATADWQGAAAEGRSASRDQKSDGAKRSPIVMALSDPAPMLRPDSAEAALEASKRYLAIAEPGGWPKVRGQVSPKSRGKAVLTLRRRLAAEDDLPKAEVLKQEWDDGLTEALRRFQFRMGLPQTGRVGASTLRELNVSPRMRARALAATAKRLERQNFRFGQRYVAVNIPALALDAVDGGKLVQRYDAIVGQRDDPSPQVKTKVVSVDLNPTWTVPASIVRKEVVPKLRKDPTYLEREHIRVLDSRGREVDPRKVRWLGMRAKNFTFRQDPGAENSLGFIRINMPNRHAVYMHDTPKKELFGKTYRFLSHGCVRVKGVYDLAAWLLEGSDGSPSGKWDKGALLEKVREGNTEEELRLHSQIPVVWAYMTGWTSPDGVTHFRRDIYRLDGKEPAPRRGGEMVGALETR